MTADEAPFLVLNAGSSSLKFAIFDRGSSPKLRLKDEVSGYGEEAENAMLARLDAAGIDLRKVSAVGHRIVHGGGDFTAPVIVTDQIFAALEKLTVLAPLHQPYGLGALKRMQALVPGIPQIACFDTAFHASQPEIAIRLPLPQEFHDKGIRRYGFHGLNYEHVCEALPRLTGKPLPQRLIIAHLGNGASMCAVKDGKSIATTMGYSTLDGLIMGTRTGAIDPGVTFALLREGMTVDEVENLFYRKSGLQGLSGFTSNMRKLLESTEPKAKFAVDAFCYWAARQAGSLAVALDGLDAIAFSGGIGENAPMIREQIVRRLSWIGPFTVHFLPADEESVIARQMFRILDQ
ncbi:MAG: acetate/propionate family kinase [Parvibaculaceae bacterium]